MCKPGWKTTEFWLTILTVAGMFGLAALAMKQANADTAAVITSVGAALSAVGYSISRAKVKLSGGAGSEEAPEDQE